MAGTRKIRGIDASDGSDLRCATRVKEGESVKTCTMKLAQTFVQDRAIANIVGCCFFLPQLRRP